ncbi:LuxR C-terminal-related transcriptional regulator [Streptomyces sp. 900105755]
MQMNMKEQSVSHQRLPIDPKARCIESIGAVCSFSELSNTAGSCHPVSVAVLAEDTLTYEGAVAALSGFSDIKVLLRGSIQSAHVLIAFVEDIPNTILRRIEQFTAAQPDTPVVLVVNSISEPELIRAIGLGVVSVILHGQATFTHIKDAVIAVQKGQPDVPFHFLEPIIRYIRRHVRKGHTGGPRLNPRDITVLGLLSDGLDTSQIAHQLNYSERTIKSVIHEVTKNLGVKNRTHAVAYAIRAGLL